MAGPTRRALLTAALAAPLSATVAGCEGAVEEAAPPLRRGTLERPYAPGGRAEWALAVPEGTPRALVVSLHGKGGHAQGSVALGFHAAAVRAGLALVSVSGGDGYWHARRDGTDSGRLVLTELVPLALREAGLGAASRVGFLGWSMGGYGSLLLASRLPRARLLGVAGMSSALWTEPGATAPGAFDDAADWRAHDVLTTCRLPDDVPVTLVCGRADPFLGANRAYVRARPGTRSTFDEGGHDNGYWSDHAPGLLRWLASLT